MCVLLTRQHRQHRAEEAKALLSEYIVLKENALKRFVMIEVLEQNNNRMIGK